MEAKKLDKVFNRVMPHLSLNSRKEVEALCSGARLPKGSLLFRPGSPNHSEYLLLDGIVRTFLLSAEGEDITLSFFEPPGVLPPHVTRTKQGKSLLYAEALSDCVALEMQASAFEALMIENLELRNFGNTVLRQELQQKVNKEIRMASWSARDRLLQFRQDFTMLENRVPHAMIASYLGITTVSLSRLRKGS